MKEALWGALVMSSSVVGLFFLRFWYLSRDRFYLFFAVAFGVLGLTWLTLILSSEPPETRHYVYLIRLVGFVLIIIGIVDKNRRSRRA